MLINKIFKMSIEANLTTNTNIDESFNYIVDDEIENTYSIIFKFSEKYGRKFAFDIGSYYYCSWLHIYDGGQAQQCVGKENEVDQYFVENYLKEKYEEDVYITYLDFFLSFVKNENLLLFDHEVSDDAEFEMMMLEFSESPYFSETIKAYNTIISQKQRLSFCVVSITSKLTSDKMIINNWLISKDYIEKVEKALYNLIELQEC